MKEARIFIKFTETLCCLICSEQISNGWSQVIQGIIIVCVATQRQTNPNSLGLSLRNNSVFMPNNDQEKVLSFQKKSI